MKEYEIVAKFTNACAGAFRPQTFFEEADTVDELVPLFHPQVYYALYLR